jgi:hypothetical protein
MCTELEVWKEARSHNSPVDLLVSPDFQTELKLRLADAEIPYEVTISDMQTAINNENPNVTDSGDEYENRKSKRVFFYLFYLTFFFGLWL